MGTQGIVSVIMDDRVLFKVVAGCNGFNAPNLAEAIRKMKPTSIHRVHKMAKEHDCGCSACLVTLDGHMTCIGLVDKMDDPNTVMRYLNTFRYPRFNPRWTQGIADYVEVVEYESEVLNSSCDDL